MEASTPRQSAAMEASTPRHAQTTRLLQRINTPSGMQSDSQRRRHGVRHSVATPPRRPAPAPLSARGQAALDSPWRGRNAEYARTGGAGVSPRHGRAPGSPRVARVRIVDSEKGQRKQAGAGGAAPATAPVSAQRRRPRIEQLRNPALRPRDANHGVAENDLLRLSSGASCGYSSPRRALTSPEKAAAKAARDAAAAAAAEQEEERARASARWAERRRARRAAAAAGAAERAALQSRANNRTGEFLRPYPVYSLINSLLLILK